MLRASRRRAAGARGPRRAAADSVDALTAQTRTLHEQRAEQDALLERQRGELDRVHGELEAAQRQLEALQRERARERAEHAARTRRLEQSVSALSVGLRQTREDIERAVRSHAWRLGHRITRSYSRIARRPIRTQGALVAALARIERVQDSLRAELASGATAGGGPGSESAPLALAGGGPTPSVAPSEAERPPWELTLSAEQTRELERSRVELAARLRERLGPPPERERWPTVTAIVPTRDGLGHLKRLFACLSAHTDYPELEVVVVDNASSDGTLDYLKSLQTPFPVHLVANAENLSFARANACGVEHASGELLLFLNNDVEPFEPGWLMELVAALEGEGWGRSARRSCIRTTPTPSARATARRRGTSRSCSTA